MDFRQRFNDARNLADNINNWADSTFTWQKAYLASVFASLAYEEVPNFELKISKRAKVIPCDSYQAHISRWEANQQTASLRNLDLNAEIDIVIRNRVIVVITKLRKVIFISLRGTTLSFADFKADIDIRKARYPIGFGDSVLFHRGFFEAVLDCFDEVVEKVSNLIHDAVPIYITGHSLGGAMAAIFHARLADIFYHPIFQRRSYPIPSSNSCYSLGMPRYGDLASKDVLPQPYHIFNELDAIPTLPPTQLGFVDSANERCLNAIPEVLNLINKGNFALRKGKGIATILGISDHRMERYVERLERMKDNA